MACTPTGRGEMAAFVFPIIRDLNELKQCPTRKLAKQAQKECLRLCEDITLRIHTSSKTNAEKKYGQCVVLITTPQKSLLFV